MDIKKKDFHTMDEYYDYYFQDSEGDDDLYDYHDDMAKEFERLINESGNEPICRHEWVLYQGLIEQYEFCKICDVKKEDI